MGKALELNSYLTLDLFIMIKNFFFSFKVSISLEYEAVKPALSLVPVNGGHDLYFREGQSVLVCDIAIQTVFPVPTKQLASACCC